MSKYVGFYVPKLKEGTLSKEELKECSDSVLGHMKNKIHDATRHTVFETPKVINHIISKELETGISLLGKFNMQVINQGIVGKIAVVGEIELFGYIIAEHNTSKGGTLDDLASNTFINFYKRLESISESSVEDFGAIMQSLYSYEIGLNFNQHCLYIKHFYQDLLVPNPIWILVKADMVSTVKESSQMGIDLPDEITNEIFSYIFDIHGSNYIEQCDNYEPLALGGEIMIAGTV